MAQWISGLDPYVMFHYLIFMVMYKFILHFNLLVFICLVLTWIRHWHLLCDKLKGQADDFLHGQFVSLYHPLKTNSKKITTNRWQGCIRDVAVIVTATSLIYIYIYKPLVGCRLCFWLVNHLADEIWVNINTMLNDIVK